MQLVSTKRTATILEPIIVNTEFGKRPIEDEGTPVYLFRSLFAEMGSMGSDLMVETGLDF